MAKKKFKWVVEIEVDEVWVADGFNLTEDRMHDIMCDALPFAYGFEIDTKVLDAPSNKRIAKAQGYKSVKDFLADD